MLYQIQSITLLNWYIVCNLKEKQNKTHIFNYQKNAEYWPYNRRTTNQYTARQSSNDASRYLSNQRLQNIPEETKRWSYVFIHGIVVSV